MNKNRQEFNRHSAPDGHGRPIHETHRILVIEDDPGLQANMREILETDGYSVEGCSSLSDIRRRDDWGEFSAILLDRLLPDGPTDDLLPYIRQMAPGTAVIIMTGYQDFDSAVAAVRHGATDYLIKPIDPDALRKRLQDVIENRHLQEKLAQLVAIVESSDDAIIGTTLNGVIASWNEGATRIYGYPAETAVGRSVSMLVPSERSAEVSQILQRIHQGDRIEHFETVRLRADGQPIHVSLSVSPVRDSHGKIVAVASIARDFTKQKQMEARLAESERLAFLGQMVAVISHEGRNALQRIYARVEMLEPQLAGQPAVLNDVHRIRLACDDLHKLQEDILTFSAPIHLSRVRCSLGGIWQTAWSNIEPLWASRNATLDEQTNGVNLQCFMDPSRFVRVFRNLFENSLAACVDPVQITVHCMEADIEGRQALQILIRDNGPGLSFKQRAKAFEPFFTTKLHGTGLGLAIAKRIVEAHHGTITVTDAPACGAGFVIKVPRV